MERTAWKHIYYRVEVRRPQVRGSVTAWGGGGCGPREGGAGARGHACSCRRLTLQLSSS